MKRTFAIVLALVMLLTTAALPVHAAAPESNEREDLLSAACEIFPEYAQRIRANPTTVHARSSSPRNELLFTETRAISNSEQLTYSEYSNGTVLLTSTTATPKYSTTLTDQQVGSGYTTTTITIRATLGGNYDTGVFTLSNVVYTIYPSAYDLINNRGNRSTSGYCSVANNPFGIKDAVYQLQENNSSNAYITYYLAFQLEDNGELSGPISTVLTLTVGDNGAGVSHYSTD